MAMHNSEGRTVGLLKILRDQTELRRTVDDLRKARVDAENAAAAKDYFLAVLSHELRTPLGPISMGLDNLSESLPAETRAEVQNDIDTKR